MLLSRYAENAYWMGRYMERAESLARLLLITESFAADQDKDEAWLPILSVFADEDTFQDRGKPLTALNVAKFYLTDEANPNSVISAAHMAKENARALRHLISTESWRQISMFHKDIASLKQRRVALSRLSEICFDIQSGCFHHRGVMQSTCYRDEVWRFNRMGAALERADQSTRLIDIKYFRFDRDDDDQVAPPAVSWWNTLLRSASGYHAFQRHHSFNAAPSDAAKFLLFENNLPMSLAGATGAVNYQIDRLDKDFNAKPDQSVKDAAAALQSRIDTPPSRFTGRSLHRFLDQVQQDIILLANGLQNRYFSPR